MIAHIVCRIAGHRRSVSGARRIDGVWRSRCKRCGAEIVRIRPTQWRHKAEVELLELREELLRHLDQRYAIVDPPGADLRSAFFQREDGQEPLHAERV